MPLTLLPQDCQERDCPSHRRCHNVQSVKLQIEESPHVDILFLSDVPSQDDVTNRRAFSSHNVNFMRDVLREIGLPAHGYAFSSLLRCRPSSREGADRDGGKVELDLCQQHLLRDLSILKPKVIVCHGIEALKVLTPQYDQHRLKYNKVFDVDIVGTRYFALAIIKTNVVMQKTALIKHYVEGITKAVDLAEHGKGSMHHPARWAASPTVHYCDTVEKVADLVEHLLHETKPTDTVSFDVETANLNSRHGNTLVMLQFCVDPHKEVWVVPYAYRYGPFLQDDLVEVKGHLKRLFTEKPNFRFWLAHYGVFEQQQVMQFITDGKTFKNAPMIDTMGLAYILDENRVEVSDMIGQGLSLKELTSEYVGRDEYDRQVLAQRAGGKLHQAKPEDLIPYAAEDVVATSLLYRYLRCVAKSTSYLTQAMLLSQHVFAGAFRVFAKLKRNGIYADLDHLRVLASKTSPLVERMAAITEEMKRLESVQQANKIVSRRESGGQRALFGSPWVFDINKQEHAQCLFFEVMGLEPIKGKKKKKTDKASVDKDFYAAYSGKHPEVELTEEYTQIKGLAGRYTRKIIKLVDPNSEDVDHSTDCRVRANFGFTDTVTGRPACSSPNIQNVPRADNPTKAAVKSMYCAEQSYGAWRKGKKVERVLMQLDYAAAEVRWWALISGDQRLAAILRNGKKARDEYRKNPTPENKALAAIAGDIHRQTASLMFGIPIDKVDKETRQITKTIVFALIYGGGVSLIAERIKKENDIPEVKRLIKKFTDAAPQGTRWLKRSEGEAKRNYYVESPLGRRRNLYEYIGDASYYPVLNYAQASAARLARNAPIQGVASDGCIIGASLWLDYIEDNNKDWKVVNIVHDSCVTEVPLDEIEEAARVAEKCFTNRMMDKIRDTWGVEFICPLEVDFDFGVAWGAMKHLDEWSQSGWDDMREWLSKGGRMAGCAVCHKPQQYYGDDDAPVVFCKDHKPSPATEEPAGAVA